MMQGRFLTWTCPIIAAALLSSCGQSALPDDAPAEAPEVERVETAMQALAGAHIPTLDPSTMQEADIRKVLGSRPRCAFRYTSTGGPVLAVGLDANGSPETGVVKLNGKLVPLDPDRAVSRQKPGGLALMADRVRLRMAPVPSADAPAKAGTRVEAEMLFEVGQELKVGYDGYLECGPGSRPAK